MLQALNTVTLIKSRHRSWSSSTQVATSQSFTSNVHPSSMTFFQYGTHEFACTNISETLYKSTRHSVGIAQITGIMPCGFRSCQSKMLVLMQVVSNYLTSDTCEFLHNSSLALQHDLIPTSLSYWACRQWDCSAGAAQCRFRYSWEVGCMGNTRCTLLIKTYWNCCAINAKSSIKHPGFVICDVKVYSIPILYYFMYSQGKNVLVLNGIFHHGNKINPGLNYPCPDIAVHGQQSGRSGHAS